MKEVHILAPSQIIVGITYIIQTWDDTGIRVRVQAKDENSVTLEYENDQIIGVIPEDDTSSIIEPQDGNVINRVPLDYFCDELEASIASRPLPKRPDCFRGRLNVMPVEEEELRDAS